MLLSCPNCGTVTEVADVLIPCARLTATCTRCGAKIGGTVPARLDFRAPASRRKGRARDYEGPRTGREGGASPRTGGDRSARGEHSAGAQRGAGEDPAAGRVPARPRLHTVAHGLDPERLARLVASDMLLYNRDKIQRSAADARLLSSMSSEIVEAWEFYKKRVGVPTALGTSCFRDALNSVLGGGDPVI